MVELPKTEQELNDLIAQKVQEKADAITAELTAKHNSEMANQRKKYDDDIKKAKEQAGKTAEELAQERIKEQQEADQKELNELRAYKKSGEISKRLAKEGLPDFFKNDTRLLNAEDGDLDKVVKEIKKEYDSYQPKGATHSTVVPNAQNQPPTDKKQEAYNKMGEALKELTGN